MGHLLNDFISDFKICSLFYNIRGWNRHRILFALSRVVCSVWSTTHLLYHHNLWWPNSLLHPYQSHMIVRCCRLQTLSVFFT